jgi:stage IV sporulation protein A
VVVTTDGSFSEIERKNYVQAEEKVINQLKTLNKPFVILLNSAEPNSVNAQKVAEELEKKHGVSVVCVNALTMGAEDISLIMEKILLEFPMSCFNVCLPKWMRTLGCDSEVVCDLVNNIKERSYNMSKMKDYTELFSLTEESDDFQSINAIELRLGDGMVEYNIEPNPELYFKVISKECGENIVDDCQLISFIKSFAKEKKKFLKIKDALSNAEENGYGVVVPSVDEINLEQPVLVKQGGRYGIKMKASAPSLHIMKVDVSTEVSPIVGTEKQSEDLINYITGQIEEDPSKIWEMNMFGKSLNDLVNEGLSSKISSMPKVAQGKLRKTVTRIVNENRGGILCILL